MQSTPQSDKIKAIKLKLQQQLTEKPFTFLPPALPSFEVKS